MHTTHITTTYIARRHIVTLCIRLDDIRTTLELFFCPSDTIVSHHALKGIVSPVAGRRSRLLCILLFHDPIKKE